MLLCFGTTCRDWRVLSVLRVRRVWHHPLSPPSLLLFETVLLGFGWFGGFIGFGGFVTPYFSLFEILLGGFVWFGGFSGFEGFDTPFILMILLLRLKGLKDLKGHKGFHPLFLSSFMVSLAQKWMEDLRPTIQTFPLPQSFNLDLEWEELKLIMASTPSEVRTPLKTLSKLFTDFRHTQDKLFYDWI